MWLHSSPIECSDDPMPEVEPYLSAYKKASASHFPGKDDLCKGNPTICQTIVGPIAKETPPQKVQGWKPSLAFSGCFKLTTGVDKCTVHIEGSHNGVSKAYIITVTNDGKLDVLFNWVVK